MGKFEFVTKWLEPSNHSTYIRNYEFRPNVGDEVFILLKDKETIIKRIVKSYYGNGIALLHGPFQNYFLDDGSVIESFWIFESKEIIESKLKEIVEWRLKQKAINT